MVKVKAKTKCSLQSTGEVPSDSKQSESMQRSTPEAEDSAPVATTTTETSLTTESIARPFAKKSRLQQQLNLVEKQACFLSASSNVLCICFPKLWSFTLPRKPKGSCLNALGRSMT